MKELADKKFIAETMIQNYYFINPGYMFNGHRLTYMKTVSYTHLTLPTNREV